jgi:hypothetical protein
MPYGVFLLQNSYLRRRNAIITSTFAILSPCLCHSLVSPRLDVVVVERQGKHYHHKLAFSRLLLGKTNEMNRSEAKRSRSFERYQSHDVQRWKRDGISFLFLLPDDDVDGNDFRAVISGDAKPLGRCLLIC